MQARELAQDLTFALDPVRLAVAMGLDPDPWQIEFLRNPSKRILLNCSRQSGKSTITALLAAHTALYRPDSLVLLLSPTQRQSHELFRKAQDAYQSIPTAIPVVQESALRLELSNGSRIVSLPGKETTVRPQELLATLRRSGAEVIRCATTSAWCSSSPRSRSTRSTTFPHSSRDSSSPGAAGPQRRPARRATR